MYLFLIGCIDVATKTTPLWFQTKTFDVYTFTGTSWSEEGYTNYYPLIINNDGYDCADYEEQANRLRPLVDDVVRKMREEASFDNACTEITRYLEQMDAFKKYKNRLDMRFTIDSISWEEGNNPTIGSHETTAAVSEVENDCTTTVWDADTCGFVELPCEQGNSVRGSATGVVQIDTIGDDLIGSYQLDLTIEEPHNFILNTDFQAEICTFEHAPFINIFDIRDLDEDG